MRDYELTYIAKPDVDATNLAALIEKVNGLITAEGGVVIKIDQWGTRRLSYPINRFRDGQYIFAQIQLEAPAVAKIESRMRLLEDVIRSLLVRAEEVKAKPQAPAAAAEAAPVVAAEAAPAA